MDEKINLFNKWTVTRKTLLLSFLATVAVVFFGYVFLIFTFGRMGAGYNNVTDNAYAPNVFPSDGNFAVDDMAFDYDEAASMEAVSIEADFLGEAEEKAYRAENSVSSVGLPLPVNRLIIKDGSISMQMENTRNSRNHIQLLVQSMEDLGAFTISSYEYVSNQEGNPYINMVIRVPSSQFDQVMDQLADMAVKIDERNESSQDVTEEYVDLENRIESMEIARDRLLQIMLGAEDTEDLLMIEMQLTRRDADLEALKGRLSYLSSAANLSRISINLYPYILNQPVDSSWNISETINRAYKRLVNSTHDFVDLIVGFIILTLPGLIVWGFIFFLGYKVIKRIFRKNTPAEIEKQE